MINPGNMATPCSLALELKIHTAHSLVSRTEKQSVTLVSPVSLQTVFTQTVTKRFFYVRHVTKFQNSNLKDSCRGTGQFHPEEEGGVSLCFSTCWAPTGRIVPLTVQWFPVYGNPEHKVGAYPH